MNDANLLKSFALENLDSKPKSTNIDVNPKWLVAFNCLYLISLIAVLITETISNQDSLHERKINLVYISLGVVCGLRLLSIVLYIRIKSISSKFKLCIWLETFMFSLVSIWYVLNVINLELKTFETYFRGFMLSSLVMSYIIFLEPSSHLRNLAMLIINSAIWLLDLLIDGSRSQYKFLDLITLGFPLLLIFKYANNLKSNSFPNEEIEELSFKLKIFSLIFQNNCLYAYCYKDNKLLQVSNSNNTDKENLLNLEELTSLNYPGVKGVLNSFKFINWSKEQQCGEESSERLTNEQHGSYYIEDRPRHNETLCSTVITSMAKLGLFVNKKNNNSYSFYDTYVKTIRNMECISGEINIVYLYDVTNLLNEKSYEVEAKLKSSFFNKVAHELKTPLIVLSSLTEKVYNRILEKNYVQASKLCLELRSMSMYTLSLTEDLIQYTFDLVKMEKEICVTNSSVNACVVVESVFNTLKTLIKYSFGSKEALETKLELDPSIGCYLLECDKNRLIQILLNLISNSIKFTKSGSIILEAYPFFDDSLCSSMTSNEEITLAKATKIIKISIIDTGVGMSKIELEKIKERMLHMNMDIRTSYNDKQGSGFGLSIVRILCKALDIKYEFDSNEGCGTRFSLMIPAIYRKNSSPDYNLTILEETQVIQSFAGESDVNLVNLIKKKHKNNKANEDLSFNGCRPSSPQSCNAKSYSITTFKRKSIDSSEYGCTQLNNRQLVSNNCLLQLNEETLKFMTIPDQTLGFEISRNPSKITDIILICDDILPMRRILKSILSHIPEVASKYTIKEVKDGIEILKSLIDDQKEGGRIKAVFTDENMEFMNGSESVRILRNLESLNKLRKCIYFSVTAYDDDSTKQSIMRSGVNELLTKPISITTVYNVMTKHHLI